MPKRHTKAQKEVFGNNLFLKKNFQIDQENNAIVVCRFCKDDEAEIFTFYD